VKLDVQPRLGDLAGLAQATTQSGLDVQFHLPQDSDGLPADVHLAAYRVVQEAVTNVLRHASASRVVVRITADSAQLVVDIDDDGQVGEGFCLGNGLIGMRERVASFGGRLDLLAEPGQGLRIQARIPLAAEVSQVAVR
jgi:signal transduction histidine kinase